MLLLRLDLLELASDRPRDELGRVRVGEERGRVLLELLDGEARSGVGCGSARSHGDLAMLAMLRFPRREVHRPTGFVNAEGMGHELTAVVEHTSGEGALEASVRLSDLELLPESSVGVEGVGEGQSRRAGPALGCLVDVRRGLGGRLVLSSDVDEDVLWISHRARRNGMVARL